MVPIDNQTRPQPIFGKLIPDVVRVPANRAVRAVAQVRAKSRAGVDRGLDLHRTRRRMSNRNHHARRRRALNELRRVVILGRHRKNANSPAGGVLQSAKLIPIRRTHVRERVRAARPIFARDVRAFQMKPDDPPRDFAALVARAAQRRQSVMQDAERIRRHRRRITDAAVSIERAADLLNAINRERRIAELATEQAVYLQIDKRRRDPWERLSIRGVDGIDANDSPISDVDSNGQAGGVVARGEEHGAKSLDSRHLA